MTRQVRSQQSMVAFVVGGLLLVCLLGTGLPMQAQLREAVAEIRGCTDPTITGRVRLIEIPSMEGVKQVIVELAVSGLSDGQHAVHIHETAECDL
jgi:Cu/Zn superoxide dismutase